jgi:predicted ABC-type transport system involved in lysophospholipase L1 biosynthesis ATPase subunit
MSKDSVIHIEHLFKEYVTDAGTVPVLKDVSVSVKSGEFVAIHFHEYPRLP